MMFNQSPEEIREWILDGVPERLREDPSDRERRNRQLISMPSYRGRVDGANLEDLVSYVKSVSEPIGRPKVAERRRVGASPSATAASVVTGLRGGVCSEIQVL